MGYAPGIHMEVGGGGAVTMGREVSSIGPLTYLEERIGQIGCWEL